MIYIAIAGIIVILLYKGSHMGRIVDRQLLSDLRGVPCAVCDSVLTEAHHLRSIAASGDDVEHNLLCLCRAHHTELHTIGLNSFVSKYITVKWKLLAKGWEFDEFRNKWVRY